MWHKLWLSPWLPDCPTGLFLPPVGRRDPLRGLRRPCRIGTPVPQGSGRILAAVLSSPCDGHCKEKGGCFWLPLSSRGVHSSVIHPTRLETRTKESNMCASLRVN